MPFVVAVAGHIDHGKTALVRTLTGVDGDASPQERQRGMTIEASYSTMLLPEGEPVSFVDVPGHERFIRNMAAGASGMDALLLVVDVREGVMPQTREHLAIASLLGVRHGIVVLTKCDFVDEKTCTAQRSRVRFWLKGSFLELAPVVAVSSFTGHGLECLKEALNTVCKSLLPAAKRSFFYMPLDRVFNKQGHGLIVTGTAGATSQHDLAHLMLYPQELPVRVRRIEQHGASHLYAGEAGRMACNLHGLARANIARGDILASAGSLIPSRRFLVRLTLLPESRSLKHKEPLLVHMGSAVAGARAYLADREQLLAGEQCYAELRFENAVCGLGGGRFFIRSISPAQTLGGGEILNPLPGSFLKKKDLLAMCPFFDALSQADPAERLELHCAQAGFVGLSREELSLLEANSQEPAEGLLQQLVSQKKLFAVGTRYVTAEQVVQGLGVLRERMHSLHAAKPLQTSFSSQEIVSGFLEPCQPLFRQLVTELCQQGEAKALRGGFCLTGQSALVGQERIFVERLEAEYLKVGLRPGYAEEMARLALVPPEKAREVLEYMQEQALLVLLEKFIYVHSTSMNKAIYTLQNHFSGAQQLSLAEAKVLYEGLSRKYLVPLLEYFDKQGFTKRQGEVRVQGASLFGSAVADA